LPAPLPPRWTGLGTERSVTTQARVRLLLVFNIGAVLLLIAANVWQRNAHIVPRIQPTYAQMHDPSVLGYCREMQTALSEGAFDRLEAEAHRLTALKDRIPGGIERLVYFYTVLTSPGCYGYDCKADYRPLERRLQDWLNRVPEQPTAWIANARFWDYFAWTAKGCGEYHDAGFDQWQTFYDRVRIARSFLRHAGLRNDPAYYMIALELLRDSGGTRQQIDAMFHEGHEAFPRFLGLDTDYASLLNTGWYGNAGDIGWFAETLLDDPGGEDGQIAYAVVTEEAASYVAYPHLFLETGLTWSKAKPGIDLIQRRYGASNYDWNMYCYMAIVAIDRPAALDAYRHFAPIWNPDVWHDADFYYEQGLPWITGGELHGAPR
jgi:hypothetical protein